MTTTPGTCRICSCTEDQACAGGCSWADESNTICSRCAMATDIAISALPLFVSLALKVKPGAEQTWQDLTPTDQQLLVMALRALSEGIEEGLRADFESEAIEAVQDLNEIGLHIIDRFPEERAKVVAGGESIADVAIRLLNQAKPALIVTG